MNAQNLRLLNTLPPIETLVCFEAVARCGSFTRAGRELSITQSAVSKQIKTLEDALHCALFDRHARGIQLSAAGARFLEELEPLLYKLQRAIAKAQYEQDSQAVSIACTQAVAHFWLFPRIVRFNQQYPEITISVISGNNINERSCSESDLGILYGDGDWPTLESAPLFPEVVYPVCSPDLKIATPAAPADLRSLPLIQLDSRQWDCLDWQDWFAHFEVPYQIPRNAITFNQVTLAFNAAVEGLGVSLGWDFMASRAIASGELIQVGNFAYETGRSDYLVRAKYRPLTRPAVIFRDWLIAEI
ncbi:LysR family transcriptional regulator [Paraburkholderia caballeronis]|uniref:LysR substrate-binding domain-containing protein n=1 Tax=Paraburkholderia caballeronis TaxID=416943 RepID=UPI001066082A|nr:LysR substrate-binding domain-containing protein [Paraburkholderia caballeronis]TDV33824.1 LysR family transcriptional regulator [Paraburkholderia caballeronis]